MLGIPFAAGTEAPLSSVMGKQRCRRIESTYPIVSPQQNRISPHRSSKGKINRKVGRWRCGYEIGEEAKAAL